MEVYNFLLWWIKIVALTILWRLWIKQEYLVPSLLHESYVTHFERSSNYIYELSEACPSCNTSEEKAFLDMSSFMIQWIFHE
jgi:hypothetical protein